MSSGSVASVARGAVACMVTGSESISAGTKGCSRIGIHSRMIPDVLKMGSAFQKIRVRQAPDQGRVKNAQALRRHIGMTDFFQMV